LTPALRAVLPPRGRGEAAPSPSRLTRSSCWLRRVLRLMLVTTLLAVVGVLGNGVVAAEACMVRTLARCVTGFGWSLQSGPRPTADAGAGRSTQ
jgi:uncharacterized membrane protein